MSSMKYPYRDLGVNFDRQFRNDLNANFDDIEHDIRMIGGEAAQQALEAAEEANTQAVYAQTSGDYANDKGDYAAQQGDYAQTQGNFANEKGLYAQQQGDYAKAQGDYAKQVGDENKTRWLTAVNTYADIATTYPNPQLGDTVQTIDDSKIYRWDGTQWVWTQQYNANAITDVQNKIGILMSLNNYTSFKKTNSNFTLNFSVSNVDRKILDKDGFLLHQTNFYANLFEPVPTDTTEGGTNYFETVIQTGSSDFTKTISNGLLTLSNNSGVSSEVYYFPRQKLRASHFFVTLDIQDCVMGTDDSNPLIVLYKNTNDRCLVALNTRSKVVEVYKKTGGTVSTYTTSVPNISFPSKLGVLVLGNRIAVFYDNAGTWNFVTETYFRDAFHILNELKQWKVGFGAYIDNGYSLSLKNFSIKATPQLGYRDHTLVTYEDGSPVIRDGKMFFTVTLGGTNMQTSGLGIISYDPKSYETQLVSLLYRKTATGEIYPDGACHAFFNRRSNEWYVLFSGFITRSYGKSTYASTYFGKTKENILNGVHHIESSLLALPNTGTKNTYDAFVIFDDSVNKWRCAYTAPAGTVRLAESDDFVTWNDIASSVTIGEGTKIVKIAGQYKVVGSYQREMYMLDYPTLTNKTKITVDTLPGHPHPHPMIVPIPSDKRKYQLVTMDGSRALGFDYSWGSTWVYECEIDEVGYDYDYSIVL